MKKLYVSESTNRKIREFNEAKKRGVHIPYVKSTFMSAGTRSILFCPAQKRVITLMSQGEKHLYITKLFGPNVVEIKEQYPLDYVLTKEIADELGVIHPRKHLTGELTVVTTDLLITYRDENGSEYRVAYAFKYSIGGRNQARTNQKLAIAEAYWKRFGVRSEQILRGDVSKDKAYNLLNYIDKYDKSICINEINEFVTALLDDVIEHPSHTLRESLNAISASLHIEPFYSMTLLANAIFRNALPIDLMQEIKLHKPIKLALPTQWARY